MGFFQDQAKKFLAPIISDAVKAAAPPKAVGDQPAVTEVPPIMQMGYGYMGGARRKYNSTIDFDTLRTFSVVYDVARACINYRKRQMSNLEWHIVPKDDKADADKFKKQIDAITNFFEEPAPQTDFKTFNDRIVEDLMVIDGAVLWKGKTYGGNLVELLPVDSTTIRMRIAPDGQLPDPPELAFDQVLFGEVKNQYTTDEMIYKMMNPRNNTPYGLSPLECLVIGVDSALRSQLYNASMLSEGSVPEGFFGVPSDWTPEQIKDYQIWFDTLLSGNLAGTSRIKFMPGGKGVGYMPTKKPEDMRFIEFEKWLLIKCCALFDVPPSAIGFIEGMPQNPGESQQQLGNERGLVPMANFLKQMYTQIIKKDFNAPDLKFEWQGLQVVDDDFELARSTMMLEHGGMTINEMRVAQGMDPLDDPIADKAMIYGRTGISPLDVLEAESERALEDAKNPKDPAPADGPIPGEPTGDQNADPNADSQKLELEEMEQWESKCIKYVKAGRGIPRFVPLRIDKAAFTLLASRLSIAKSKEEVRAAFKPFKEDLQEKTLIKEALGVSDRISKFKREKYERAGQGA